jgi:plastocyanin
MPRTVAPSLAVLLLASWTQLGAPARAENHRVRVLDSRFEPATLDILPGDTVTWTNEGAMAHNVRADDTSFRCAEGCDEPGAGADPSYDPTAPGDDPGDPSSARWSSTVRFDREGDVRYYCEVHGARGGVGMSGMVRVGSGSGGSAGSIELAAARFTVREDRGPAVVRVSRTGGAAGAVSARVVASAGTAAEGIDFQPVSELVSWADGATGERSVQVPILDDSIPEPPETVALALIELTGGATLGARAAGEIRIEDDDGDGDDRQTGDGGVLALVHSASAALEGGAPARLPVSRTGSTQGRVTVDWRVEGAEATAEDLAAPAGGTLVWEAGDGDPQEIEVAAIDDGLAEGAESARVVLFGATGGAVLGEPFEAEVLLVDPEDGPCASDQSRLCLDAGRFVVRVAFAPPGAGFEEARAVELTDDAGYFTFFDPDNVEVVVKALDACGFSQRFWIFAAGLTDVAVRLAAVDTLAGEARVYVNPPGAAFVPVQDTAAFATCP